MKKNILLMFVAVALIGCATGRNLENTGSATGLGSSPFTLGGLFRWTDANSMNDAINDNDIRLDTLDALEGILYGDGLGGYGAYEFGTDIPGTADITMGGCLTWDCTATEILGGQTIDHGASVEDFDSSSITFPTGGWIFADENVAPTVVGQFKWDNTVTGLNDGALSLHDGTDVNYLLIFKALPTTNGQRLEYNSATDEWETKTVYGYQEIPIAWAVDGTSGPDAINDTTRTPYKYRTFSSAADEDVNFSWVVPANCNVATAIQFRVYYLVTAATGPSASEGVAFSLAGVSIGDNDVTNAAKGTAVTVTDDTLTATQWDLLVTGWSGDVTVTNLAAGEMVEANFERTTADAVDDYGQLVGVTFIQLRYVEAD